MTLDHICLFFFNFYLFLAVLGLRCFEGFSLVAMSRDYSVVVVNELLMAVGSLVAEHGLSCAWVSVATALRP